MKNLALMMIRDSGLIFWATAYVMLGNPVSSMLEHIIANLRFLIYVVF